MFALAQVNELLALAAQPAFLPVWLGGGAMVVYTWLSLRERPRR